MSVLDQDYELSAGVGDELTLDPGFERFYREHYPFVWRSARRMLAGAGDDRIEDVIQDTWIAAYRRFESFAGECRPTTWLFGILRNVVRNHERGERRHNRRIAAFVEHEREQSRGLDEATRLLAPKLLDAFLRTLDEDKRAVFVLAELEGQSGREIAEALHINPNTAHSRLRAARQQFCAYFELPHSREQLAGHTRSLREQPEQPPALALARSRALLIVGLGKGTLVASGGGGLSAAMLVKIAGAIAAVLVAAAGVVAADQVRDEEAAITVAAEHDPPPQRERERTRAAAAAVELANVEPPDESPVELAPIPVRAPATRRGPPPPSNYELLRQARAALVEGQPERALELAAAISAKSLRVERVATEVAALCRLDRGSEARAVLEAFAAAEPDSPLLARLDFACW